MAEASSWTLGGVEHGLKFASHALCAGRQEVAVVCRKADAALSTVIAHAEKAAERIATEVTSQSLQVLRNVCSFSWELVLGLLRS